MAVAKRMKTEKYDTDEWKQFYESLMLVFRIEKELHEIEHAKEDDDELNESELGQPRLSELFSVAKSEYLEIIKSIDHAEEQMKSASSVFSPASSQNVSIREESTQSKTATE